MITREQVRDLQAGDVVELSNCNWHGAVVKGPVHSMDTGYLCVGEYAIARPDGEPFPADRDLNLSIASRAPRPLYVNHPRTEPVPGDVVRDADSEWPETWTRNAKGFSNEWLSSRSHNYVQPDQIPTRLRLLVDGETGQVVP